MFEVFKAFGTLAIQGQEKVNAALTSLEGAGRNAARNLDQISGAAKRVGGDLTQFLTAPILGAVAALARLGTNFIERSNAIRDAAREAGTSTTEIQRIGFAARRVGTDMGTASAAISNLNRGASEFARGGGGSLSEFFETIGPRVGLSARNFARLSGPDALIAYYRALDRANLSQSEMNRFLDLLAPGASRLAPLLANNGAEFRRLGDEAERTGAILGTEALNAAQRLADRQQALRDRMSSLSDTITERLLPTIETLFTIFETRGIPVIERIAEVVGGLADRFNALSPAMQEGVITFALLAAAVGPFLFIFAGVAKVIGLTIFAFTSLFAIGAKLTAGVSLLAAKMGIFSGAAVAATGLLSGFVAGAKALGVYLVSTLIPAIVNFLIRFTPVGLAFAAGYAAGKLLVAAFEAMWPYFRDIGALIGQGVAAIPGLLREAGNAFARFYEEARSWVSRLASEVADNIRGMVSSVISSISNMVDRSLGALRRLYDRAVGNSIIPDLSRDVVGEMRSMASGSISATERMARGVGSSLEGIARPELGLTGPGGMRGGVVYDMRHAIIRDDRDAIERMRLYGADLAAF